MPYSVEARNMQHRRGLAAWLGLLGVSPALAVGVARRLAGRTARRLAEELRKAMAGVALPALSADQVAELTRHIDEHLPG